MNGVTGRMGTNQHLLRSIQEIVQQGGVQVNGRETILPDPVLVGRNGEKLAALAKGSIAAKWTTDLEEALSDDRNSVYFDAQTTKLRADSVKQAIAAGKHIYCEKPTAMTASEAYDLYVLAEKAQVKHGVVQDKLWLPGLQKLSSLVESGFFGRIFAIRGEFGYWVFEGDEVPAQRPSWNYRREDGGGLILDMFPHWRYILDNLFGEVRAVSCTAATHVEKRWDENGNPYPCTAEDSAYATFKLEGGAIARFNSSWSVRVRRDDLLTIQVDGARGTAVAGLRDCLCQSYENTPRPVWNPDIESPINYLEAWTPVSQEQQHDNAFKLQWELFLRHVVKGEPFGWDLLEGAKGVQLAEKAMESSRKQAWVEIPPLNRG